MRHEWWHVDEITGAGIRDEFRLSPSACARGHSRRSPLSTSPWWWARFSLWQNHRCRFGFSAPQRACVMAAARFMPGVCAVLVDSEAHDNTDAVIFPLLSVMDIPVSQVQHGKTTRGWNDGVHQCQREWRARAFLIRRDVDESGNAGCGDEGAIAYSTESGTRPGAGNGNRLSCHTR